MTTAIIGGGAAGVAAAITAAERGERDADLPHGHAAGNYCQIAVCHLNEVVAIRNYSGKGNPRKNKGGGQQYRHAGACGDA